MCTLSHYPIEATSTVEAIIQTSYKLKNFQEIARWRAEIFTIFDLNSVISASAILVSSEKSPTFLVLTTNLLAIISLELMYPCKKRFLQI